MTPKSNATDSTSQRTPTACNALRTGSLVSAVIISGLLLACDSSGVPHTRAATAVPAVAQNKTVADRPTKFQRFAEALVNHYSTSDDSELFGASIAEYEKGLSRAIASSKESDQSGSVPSKP